VPYRRAERAAGPPLPPLPWRRDTAALRTLAREVVQGLAMVTDRERDIKNAFMMMTLLVRWSEVETDKIGAFIGYVDEAVKGRAINGYPIFYSMGFLHADDVDEYNAHLTQMQEALQ
jgi:hypothetical protein